jgi:hypothetical protein
MESKQISLGEVYEKLVELERVLKKMNLHFEDMEFSKKISEAWGRYDKREFKSLPEDKFLEQLERW